MRGHVAVGVGAGVGAVLLLQRLGQRHAIGRDDGAALDVLGAGDGVVVGWHVLIVLGLDDLDIGEVADKDGEQRRKGEHGAGQAVGECHAAEHAGFGRVEQAAAHARAGRVAAAAIRRRGGKARTGRGCGGCDLVVGDGRHGAGAGEFGLASGCLVTGAQQQCDDDKARQQRGAALAHKGQGNAGQRDQTGHAAHNQESLEADGGRKARGAKSGKVGLGAGGCGQAANGKEHKQDEHGAAAQKAHLLADGREDKVGLDDGDVVGHPVADANTDQTAIGKREERLDDLVALALGVLKRIDPNLETHLNVRQELVGAHGSNGQERKTDNDIRESSRGNVEHQQEDGVEQHSRTQVAFEDDDEQAHTPHGKQRQQQSQTRDLKAQDLAVGDGEQLAVLG